MSYEYSVSAGDLGALAGIFAGAGIVIWIVTMLLSILLIVAQWKMFVKADIAGWKCLIPIYNMYCLFEIAQGNGARLVLMLIPFYNFYIMITLYIDLAKSFGKSTGFGVAMIFFPFILLPMLGLSKKIEYVGVEV